MLRTILVDDEEDARAAMRIFLKSYCPKVEVIEEAEGVEDAYLKIRMHQPDLVFLDVHMNDGSGFDLLEKLKGADFAVVFTTAFDNFAIRAFKYSAIDYLTKPIDPDELIDAVNKVLENTEKRGARIDQLIEFNQGRIPERISIASADGITMVNLDDIIRLESDSNYTHLFLRDNEKITVPKPLKEYEELLPEDRFFRIHQSHLVNLKYVKKYVREDGGSVIMEDGSQAYVARRRKDAFLERLMK